MTARHGVVFYRAIRNTQARLIFGPLKIVVRSFMELPIYILKCWRCREENRILILPGTGAYECNRCDAVILDTEPMKVYGSGIDGAKKKQV